MTVQIECTIRGGKILPLDQDKIRKWKERHKEGNVFDMFLDDGASSALTPLAKKYFATRDEYGAVNGYSNEEAHIELKALHGVIAAPDAVPVGRTGRVVDYHGTKMWQLSVRDMTSEELGRLVSGAEMALQEASV